MSASATRTRGVHAPTLPSPRALGLPSSFPSYRPTQIQAVHDITESSKQSVIINAPTGTGKTLIPFTVGTLEQSRVLILTATRALQDVYTNIFAQLGMVDVRGANNYPCPALSKGGELQHLNYGNFLHPTADKGPCLHGVACGLKSGGCERFDRLRSARRAQFVVSNYDCWLWQGRMRDRTSDPDAAEPMGTFDYIFMDEFHAAAAKVSDVLRIELPISLLAGVLDGYARSLPSVSSPIAKWRDWGRDVERHVSGLLDEAQTELRLVAENRRGELMKEVKGLREVQRIASALKDMDEGWVGDAERGERGERGESAKYTFEPIWPARYCESLLYRGIKHRVGMSATIRPAALKYAGMGASETETDFFEYDSPFPVSRRLVWQWPAVQLNYNTEKDPGTQRRLAAALDEIRASRNDRKSLIHAISYSRMRMYAQLTTHKGGLMTHEPSTLQQRLAEFKRSGPGTTFCSPVIDTGYDFPMQEAECGVIMKTPYPPMGSAVMKARVRGDRKFLNVYAADKITQMAGRTDRSVEDRGETIIPDSTVGALFNQWELFPKWFRKAWRFTRECPPAPPRLGDSQAVGRGGLS